MPKEKTKNHNPNETNQQEDQENMEPTQSEMSMEEDWEQDQTGALGGEVSDVDIIEFYQDDENPGIDDSLRGDDEADEDENNRQAA